MNDESSFTRAGDIIKSIFEKITPAKGEKYHEFSSVWTEIVDEELAFHVKPEDISNGVLLLRADHPGWIQKIKMKERDILSSVNGRYPELEIKKIKISVSKNEKWQ